MYSPLSFMPVVSDPAKMAPAAPDPVESKLQEAIRELEYKYEDVKACFIISFLLFVFMCIMFMVEVGGGIYG